jgi:hypothetical protein
MFVSDVYNADLKKNFGKNNAKRILISTTKLDFLV